MLLLDRKTGESVIITAKSGEKIKVTIVSNNEFGVKIGFDANKNIDIKREEISG